jgi:mannose-1-phosphate guanylyltransferase
MKFTSDPADQPWAIVLAGGEGVRLRPLVRRLYRDNRPKQFAALFGSRSMLRQTLDRVRLAIAPDRTVVVTHRNHDRYLAEALDGARVQHVLAQPEDRGTAAGVLLPTYWIDSLDPEAIVAIFPSDHFVREEEAFMEHVSDVVALVREHRDWIVLLGAPPTEAEPEYGWIEPGEVLTWSRAGEAISRVQQFWEKPSPAAAKTCLEKGWLWNTFVFVATASSLITAASQLLPHLHEQLSLIRWSEDPAFASRAVQDAYAFIDKASFSRSVLETRPDSLVVSRLPRVTWSDWGTPERVVKSLRRAGVLPGWFDARDLAQGGAA